MLTNSQSIEMLDVLSVDGKEFEYAGCRAHDGTPTKLRGSISDGVRPRGVNPWPSPGAGDSAEVKCGCGEQKSRSGYTSGYMDSAFGMKGGGFGSMGKTTFLGRDEVQSSFFRPRSSTQADSLFTDKSRLTDSTLTTASKSRRSVRRSGGRRRNGGSNPGHCFHCGEHGHISKECPKKATTLGEELRSSGGSVAGGGAGFGMYLTPPPKVETSKAVPTTMSSYDAKLENQKLRDSYYNKCSLTPLTKPTKTVTAAPTSSDVDKFSEQLENALKLSPSPPHAVEKAAPVSPTSMPRASVLHGTALGAGDRCMRSPSKSEAPAVSAATKPELSDMVQIETRRTVMREGECHIEETTIIAFPRVLPPNVRVITAQFVPVSTQ